MASSLAIATSAADHPIRPWCFKGQHHLDTITKLVASGIWPAGQHSRNTEHKFTYVEWHGEAYGVRGGHCITQVLRVEGVWLDLA